MLIRCAKRQAATFILGGLATILGCGVASESLNPQFMAVLGTPFAPVAPGNAPFVVARVVNMTPENVYFNLSWEPSGAENPMTFWFTTLPDTDGAVVLSCPIDRLTIGDTRNPSTPGALLVFDNNVRQEIPTLNKVLLNGLDYFCGDLVIFAVVKDSSVVGGYSVIYGVVDGTTQGTEFSGPDTFNLLSREIGELIAVGVSPYDQAMAP